MNQTGGRAKHSKMLRDLETIDEKKNNSDLVEKMWMDGMLDMLGMLGTLDMLGMLGMLGMLSMLGMLDMLGMLGMLGMLDMLGMLGMLGMFGMLGMLGMLGILGIFGMLGMLGTTNRYDLNPRFILPKRQVLKFNFQHFMFFFIFKRISAIERYAVILRSVSLRTHTMYV